MSLAITEKRPERPGGWTGIFFQLWDWNRRLTKKKLFSKKLLPPARSAKRAARKFAGDEKMPMAKLLLIADENRGGFPNAKKPMPEDDLGNTMRAPGLVARLMGLESMPAVACEKPRKALDSKFHYNGDGHGSKFSRLDQDLSLEAGGLGKLETRPQKLQKTGGFLERRQSNAAGVGQNAISKNVLSPRARKPHHKLASPVKSPRLLAGSHRARLMQAATKILEPGLQSRNQAKYALTCVGSMQAGMENSDAMPKKSKEFLGDSLAGSCMSRDNLVEVSEVRLGVKESLGGEYVSGSSQCDNGGASHDGSTVCKTKCSIMQSEQSQTTSLAVQAKFNVRSRAPDLMEKKQKIQIDQGQRRAQLDGMSRFSSKRNNLRQNQMTAARDKVTPESKVCSRKQSGRDPDGLDGPKDFVAVKRSSNYHSRTRSPSKVLDSRKAELGRNGLGKNMARKRTMSISHIENRDTVNATFVKQRSVRTDLLDCMGRGPGSNQSLGRNCVKTEVRKEDDHKSTGSKDYGIVSFTFNSPMRHESRPFSFEEVMQKSRSHRGLSHEVPHQKRTVVDASNKNLPFYRTTLRGDEISNLLEQKIRELTCLDHDELTAKDAKSTSSILEELISALTARAPISEEKGSNYAGGPSTATETHSHIPDLSDFTLSHSQILHGNREFQEDTKTGITAASLASDTDQPSPISILEASFSNDSCSLGSPIGSSGKLHSGLTECCNRTQSLDLDIDLLDSATSIDIGKSGIQKGSYFFGKDSSKQCTRSLGIRLPETKFGKSSQAIINAELLFEHISGRMVDSTLETFLLDTIETVVSAFAEGQKGSSTCTREFLFDCMLECLDSKYSRFCTSGYKTWSKRPLLRTGDRLAREVHDEIRGWIYLAGTVLDDMIENDINHSIVKWTNCEIEAFETGMEIESDILQGLVNEMVIDLCRCIV